MHTFCRGCFFEYGTKMAADALARGGGRPASPRRSRQCGAAGLAGLGLTLLLSWLAALAMNHDVLPGTDVRLAALVCCGLACLAAGALSPRPEQGRALGGAMTWAVWAIGYLILKAAVGAQVFCAATAMTLLTALAAAIVGSCIFHKKLRNRTKKKKRKQKRYYGS